MASRARAIESERLHGLLRFERELAAAGRCRIAGLDEAGRGPLAGPVVAAAVILPPVPTGLEGLDDSKRLGAARRRDLEERIRLHTLDWSIGLATAREIEERNILEATRLAMQRALASLLAPPDHLLVDALALPSIPIPQTSLIRGDSRSLSIAAASVLAKESRDRIMVELDGRWPDYGLARHKGYPTRRHREVLRRLGASPAHRSTFRGVRENQLPLTIQRGSG